MNSNRFLPLIIPVFIFILFQVFFFNARMIYVVLVLANLSIFFIVWQFCKSSIIDKSWWNFFILPSLMLSAIITYSVLLTSKTVIQTLFILTIIFLYFYFKNIYYYLERPSAYQPYSIENASSYGNFLIFFLISASIYGLQSFLNLKISVLMIIMLFASFLMIYQVIWANKIKIKNGIIFILLSCLTLVEITWSISFLPLNHNIAGLILAICYYAIIGMTRYHLLEQLNREKIKIYLIISITSVFIILFTARWL